MDLPQTPFPHEFRENWRPLVDSLTPKEHEDPFLVAYKMGNPEPSGPSGIGHVGRLLRTVPDDEKLHPIAIAARLINEFILHASRE